MTDYAEQVRKEIQRQLKERVAEEQRKARLEQRETVSDD